MDKRNTSRITSSRSLKSATFFLADWRLLHPKELPGDLHVPLECHTLTMNMIVLQLSDAVADISMLQCSAQFWILIINAHFVANNATHVLVSSATVKPTFNWKRKSSSSVMDGLQRREEEDSPGAQLFLSRQEAKLLFKFSLAPPFSRTKGACSLFTLIYLLISSIIVQALTFLIVWLFCCQCWLAN